VYTEFKTACKKIAEREFTANYSQLTATAADGLLKNNLFIFADVRKSSTFVFAEHILINHRENSLICLTASPSYIKWRVK
jgi:hypothetical protein